MIQYWVQIPVENAREVTQRFIYDNLSAYDGYELTYNVETESVVMDLSSSFTFDFHTIYFGEVRIPITETDLVLTVSDNTTSVQTLTSLPDNLESGRYPFVIFNEVASKPVGNAYFVGYKFTIDAIEPAVSKVMSEDSEIFETEDGIDTIQL